MFKNALKWLIGFCVTVGVTAVFLVILLYDQPAKYKEQVALVEQRCNVMAASDVSLGLDPDQIECRLIHDDWIVTFEVSKDGHFAMNCLPDRSFSKPFGVRDCRFYQRKSDGG